MTQRPLAAWIAVGPALAVGSAATAAVTTFDDRAAFEAAWGSDLVRESFEDRPVGQIDLPFTLPGSGFGIDVLPLTDYEVFITDAPVFSLPSDGVNHLAFLFGQGTYMPTFSMPGDSLAFGFDLSGYQDYDGSDTLDVELFAGGFLVDTITFAAPPGIQPGFLGFISDLAFDEVRVTIEDGNLIGFGDFTGFDQLTVGFVPAPGGLALLALAGLGGGRRRRG